MADRSFKLDQILLRIDELERRVAEQDRLLAEQNRLLAKKDAVIRDLQGRLKKAEAEGRKGKRQATPFSKGKRKKDPKKPGRKKGKGTFSRKKAPEPTEPPVSVPVKGQFCTCGGELTPCHEETVTVTELPERPTPKVTPYVVQVSACKTCGKRVRGKHSDLASDQSGATAHRYGPRARAAAHVLHYGLGVTVRKCPQVLSALTGLKITQGAITQDALRQMGGAVGEEYTSLRESVRDSDYVHTDDTGWKIAGENAQLMVFETTGHDSVTVFQIRQRHRNEEVRELIPADYGGTMTTDRASSYDAEELDAVAQNKCISHLKRNISKAQESQPAGARSFTNRLKVKIDAALELWHDYHEKKLPLDDFIAQGGDLRAELSHLLRDRAMIDPDNQRLLNGLGKQDDRGHLLRFLEDPGIEPTNNRAERALRPAVIARKVSQCSKTTSGAEAHAGFMSVIRTLASRGFDMLDGLAAIMSGQLSPIRSPPPNPSR